MADSLVVVEPNADLVLVDQPTVLMLQSDGGSGPTGPAGPPGGAAFLYTQASPAGTWIVNHGLNSLVHVTVLNSSGVVVEADVTESSLNTVTIAFSTPQSGKALVSP